MESKKKNLQELVIYCDLPTKYCTLIYITSMKLRKPIFTKTIPGGSNSEGGTVESSGVDYWFVANMEKE